MARIAFESRGVAPGLTANDLAKSIHFYVDGLGFTITDRNEADGKLRYVMLKAGNAELAFRFRHMAASFGMYAMIAKKHKQGIGAVAFLLSQFNKVADTVIHEAERIQFFNRGKAVIGYRVR